MLEAHNPGPEVVVFQLQTRNAVAEVETRLARCEATPLSGSRSTFTERDDLVSNRKSAPSVMVFWVGACLSLFAPSKAWAIPQFARRYNLKCSACHTIAPVLNQQGYLFKRLGYHLPPALEAAKPAPTISDLVKNEPQWSFANNVSAAVADFSYSAERIAQEGGSPSSTSAFQVASWNAYFAGWVPDTNFFYYSEFDIVTGGSTNPQLTNAHIGYAGGNARSSWYIAGGRDHVQVSDGTRAAEVYSLLPNPPLLLENQSPTTFIFDQAPACVSLGYTFASRSYRNVLAASVKVTNGDNADGSEILGPSTRNSKDVWADIDWWYAPESGITFVNYYGQKDQVQDSGLPSQFTFHPHIRRQGLFANYMLKFKVDFLGGYMHSNDDWQSLQGGPMGRYTANNYYGAVDYYIVQGLAVSARYDLLHEQVTDGVGVQSLHDWTVGVNKTLTPSGNVIGRAGYSALSGRDPLSAIKTTDKRFQVDILFNF